MKYRYKLKNKKNFYTVHYGNGKTKRKYETQINTDIFNKQLKQLNNIAKKICKKYYNNINNIENYFIFKVLMSNFYINNLKYNHEDDEYYYFESCETIFIDALFYLKYKNKKIKLKGV